MRDRALELPDQIPAAGIPVPGTPVREFFRQVARQRGFTPDPAQLAAVERLQRCQDEWVAYKERRRTRLQKLVMRPPLPRGVYLWGGVGRGKTLLMDLFFTCVPLQRKTRVHFHAFMRETHEALRRYKGEPDPLVLVAAEVARRHRLICFDEFHVSDIADAMILGRLLAELLSRRVVFCMTSNYVPGALYPNGLQRERFLPAAELLERELDIVNVDGGTDYRLRALERCDAYLWPVSGHGESRLHRLFERISQGIDLSSELFIAGRRLVARRHGPGIIWFEFAALCGGPRSQNDYLQLATEYHTVVLTGVPRLTARDASAARRFTWLVDILYDHRVNLVVMAEAPPEELYLDGLNSAEFARTVSRLQEMQSRDYLSAAHVS
ncbi:MAG: cell division protein ZapE [Pseudomonadota bacterium]